VLVGDFFQLPPVIPRHEHAVLAQMGYSGPYAYNSNVLENYPPVHFELSKVYRQRDAEFVNLLSDLRVARNVEETVQKINNICVGPHRDGHMPVLLTATNAVADRYNKTGLSELTTNTVEYESETKGKFSNNRLPVPAQLTLKKGARVMAVRNVINYKLCRAIAGADASGSVAHRAATGAGCECGPQKPLTLRRYLFRRFLLRRFL